MLRNYSSNCDYLRERFNLPDTINMYGMVDVVTRFIKGLDEKEEIEKLSKLNTEIEKPTQKSQPKKKEKKRGRPKKSSSN